MRRALPALVLAALVLGCSSQASAPTEPKPDAVAIAHLMPSANARKDAKFASVVGEIQFIQRGDTTQVIATIQGLPANASFGFHIHDNADLSDPDLKSAGGHWDPGMKKHHGAEEDMEGHAGDMGNITSNANGVARVDFKTKKFLVVGEPCVIGHSVILHASPDDLKSQPAGNSGPRIAGGVIFKQ